jgi:hypothetical protein
VALLSNMSIPLAIESMQERVAVGAALGCLLLASPAHASREDLFKPNHLYVNLNRDTHEVMEPLVWSAFFERSLIDDLLRVGVGYAYDSREALNSWWRGPAPWTIGERTSHRFYLVTKLGMLAETGGATSSYNASTGKMEFGGLFLRWFRPWSEDGYFSIRFPVYVVGVGYYDRRLKLDEAKLSQYDLDQSDLQDIREHNPAHKSSVFLLFRLDLVEINVKLPGVPIAVLGAVGLELRPYLGLTASVGLSF